MGFTRFDLFRASSSVGTKGVPRYRLVFLADFGNTIFTVLDLEFFHQSRRIDGVGSLAITLIANRCLVAAFVVDTDRHRSETLRHGIWAYFVTKRAIVTDETLASGTAS